MATRSARVSRVLDLAQPFLSKLPKARIAERNSWFKQGCLTFIAQILFEVCIRIPLYGINCTGLRHDPLNKWARYVFASNRATPMELGVAPIAASRIIIFLFNQANIANLDPMNVPEDLDLLIGMEKFLTIVFTIGGSLTCVLSGMYGDLSVGNAILILVQLCLAEIIVVWWDKLLHKDVDCVSTVSLLIYITMNNPTNPTC